MLVPERPLGKRRLERLHSTGMERSARRRRASGTTVVGVIADTHGLLRPEAVAALAFVDLIVHAGDIGSAALLYGIFTFGDQLARRVMPRGEDEIRDIYALRQAAPKDEIALRLATVIAPAEELFWRGFVQRRAGGLAAAAGYGGAHLVTGNTTLIGAAAVAGVYWGLLRRLGMSMPALITSHIAWDIWIFLLAPTEGASEEPDAEIATRD